jgi:hypothetical protein
LQVGLAEACRHSRYDDDDNNDDDYEFFMRFPENVSNDIIHNLSSVKYNDYV